MPTNLTRLFQKIATIKDSIIYKDIQHDDLWRDFLFTIHETAPEVTQHEVIRDYMERRWDGFYEDLEVETVFSDGLLVVHRCIEIMDPEAFMKRVFSGEADNWYPRYSGLGIYWTWSFKAARCHWANFKSGHQQLILTGLIDIENIDIKKTVLANFAPSNGEDEREIRLKAGSPVLLSSISLSETDPRWQFEPPIHAKA